MNERSPSGRTYEHTVDRSVDGPVLVTGASGFIGAHTAAVLLQRGIPVRASVSRPGRIADARSAVGTLHPSGADIEIVVADLNDDAGWDAAVAGASDVIHVASPLPAEQPKDPNELIAPARDGARRVLEAARRHDIGRVVLTSSVAAIAGAPIAEPFREFTEHDWTDVSVKGVSAYNQSKTIAERAARDDVAEHGGPDLVTVNPGLVLGPLARPELNASVEVVERLLTGKVPMIPKIGFDVVDVRDVADLHVAALLHPDASGSRFPATAGYLWFADIARIMRDELGADAAKVPSRMAPSILIKAMSLVDGGIRTIRPELGQHRTTSSATSQDRLGWTPRDPSVAVIDCAHSLIAHGLVG